MQIIIAEPDGFPDEALALLQSEGRVVLCGPNPALSFHDSRGERALGSPCGIASMRP